MQDRQVYELDTDALISDLLQALIDQGEDVVEQVPAGVWWLRTNREITDVCHSITESFSSLVSRNLRQIDQR